METLSNLPETQQQIINYLQQGYKGKFETTRTGNPQGWNPNRKFSVAQVYFEMAGLREGQIIWRFVKFHDVLALEKKGFVTVTYASLDHQESEGTFQLKEAA